MSQLAKIGHLLRVGVGVHLRPYWKLHGLLALAVVTSVTFEVCSPLAIKYLIDEGLVAHQLEPLRSGLVMLVLLFAASTLARYVMAIVKAYMQDEMNGDLRIVLIRMMQRLPLSYFDQVQVGHFATLFDTEMLTLSGALQDLFRNGLQALLQLAVVLGTMFVLNWQLALAVTVLLPIAALLPQRQLKRTVDATDAMRKNVERINAIVQDHVSTQALVHAFGRQEHATRRFVEIAVRRPGARGVLKRVTDVRRTLRTNSYFAQTFRLSLENQEAGAFLMVVAVGASLSYAGLLSIGTFAAFILFLPKLMQAVSRLGKYVQDLTRASLSLDRFEAIEKAMLREPPAGTIQDLPVPTQAIEFDQVGFSYSAGQAFMTGVNLRLPIGQSMAFVGRSGSGKSTLFKLLLGLFSPTAGRILIDGQDLSQVSRASLGSHIGTVLQQAPMLNTSIRENIAFAKPQASDEEIAQAARLAGIHDYIVSLPKGYDSGVGDGGRWLSEGQKQRIALARAILPNPAILLLDEVTSSLDPESEAAVNATIQTLARQRTVILVTHRLASASFVDHLVVVDEGQVKEQGSHAELLAQPGLYQRMWQMQSGFVVSGDGRRAEVHGERLQAIALFRDVAITTLNALATQFTSNNCPAGESLYREGDAGDKFFIIVRGTVSVSSRNAGDQSIRLATLQDGDYFGEGEMLSRGRRTTTVTATTPSLVLALRAEHFNAMVKELSLLNKVVTQMALGRSLSTICSVGRRRRTHGVWQGLVHHAWT